VDNMEVALPAARARILPGGQLAVLTTTAHTLLGGRSIPLPNSQSAVLYFETIIENRTGQTLDSVHS
jgi:hypothetical protein